LNNVEPPKLYENIENTSELHENIETTSNFYETILNFME
jgi:hypothetical protein